jgi:hypothetical protein
MLSRLSLRLRQWKSCEHVDHSSRGR